MKLAYFQSVNECDPLPKLGRKVDKTDIIDHASFERAESIKAFEIGEHYIKPEWLGADFAHDGTGYIEPESVVSFADAAVIAYRVIKPAAEVVEKKAPSKREFVDAYSHAVDRVGMHRAFAAWRDISLANNCMGSLCDAPHAWPAAIAALEALR